MRTGWQFTTRGIMIAVAVLGLAFGVLADLSKPRVVYHGCTGMAVGATRTDRPGVTFGPPVRFRD